MSQRYLILDYETRSEADLKKIGSFEYSVHPSTRIMCVAWRLGTKEELRKVPTKVWSPAIPFPYGELIKALCDPSVICVAHNALFEQVITRNVLSRIIHRPELKSIPHERWICTASLAAALALPRSLEGACAALKLPVQKDMEGRRLMLKLSKPRKPTKNNPAKWHSKRSDLERVMEYCAADIAAEVELLLRLPPLTESEREIWLLDQKINFRGLEIDRDLVEKVLVMIDEETSVLNAETRELNGGAFTTTNQRAEVLKWIESEKSFLPDLRAKTVSDALKENLVEGKVKRLLEIRQAVSKTSTKKYKAFEMRSRSDGRVRDNLLYHGASTGRWSGMGVQLQNLARGRIKDTWTAAEVLREGDLELVRMIYGDPMSVFSSCLRSVIVPPKGKEFFCADFAAIEARVGFWIAKHESGLQAYREERDLYKEMASAIFDKPVSEIDKDERFVGKTAVLGCSYGMGSKKFMGTCENLGHPVTEEVAQAAVSAYRKIHHAMPKLWSNLERAAIAAISKPGTRYKINYTTWFVEKGFLWCELPSGRRLAYYGPEIRQEATSWGEKRPTIYHYGVNPRTKKWQADKTWGGVLTENVVQATSRDFMTHGMLALDRAGYEINVTIHDEILCDREKGTGSIEEFVELMTARPKWALDCPIKAEGWSGPRFKK